MGISYRGVLCVGYTYDQALELMGENQENVYDWIEDNGLESHSPHYDADSEDCIYGYTVFRSGEYSYNKIPDDIELRIKYFKDQLISEYGDSVMPEAYIMAHGW
ncbi:hypothetical protein D3C85_378160 [compost metagenome]